MIFSVLILLSCLVTTVSSYGAVVIGGGPSGLLSSISLAGKGHSVKVFDAPREKQDQHGQTSYNLVLTGRGINALERFNVEYEPFSVDVKSIIRHDLDGSIDIVKCQRYISIDRNDLINCLKRRAESVGVEIHHSTFYDMDLKKKEVHLDSGSVEYDLLVGADGTNSRVRSSLGIFQDRFHFREDMDNRVFKTFHLGREELMKVPRYEGSWMGGFHVWYSGTSELVCPPTIDGGITGAFVTNARFEYNKFSDVFGVMGESDRISMIESKPRSQKYVYCSHVGLGDVLLVGDAAHSMPASLGQGVNSALEDAVYLDRCMAINLHVDEMVGTYNNCRIEDAHAVCDLCKESSGYGYRNGNQGERRRTVVDINKAMLYMGRADASYSDILKFCSHEH